MYLSLSIAYMHARASPTASDRQCGFSWQRPFSAWWPQRPRWGLDEHPLSITAIKGHSFDGIEIGRCNYLDCGQTNENSHYVVKSTIKSYFCLYMRWPLRNFYTFDHVLDSYRNTIFEWAVGFRYDNITVKLVLGKKNLACRRPTASQASFSSHGLIFEVKKFPFSHSNSSKTTGQKNPLHVTSDLQRVFLPGHSCCDLTSFSIL